MLVLSRSHHQKTVIQLPDGNKIVITVVEIDGQNRVRIGFDAPQNCRIVRKEVIDRHEPSEK